ncbi:MAG: hypothetical protein IPO07_28565 [Haliscomenobacter sp.]|nr:hypothetical protein [Haliscomenobacter sp.]
MEKNLAEEIAYQRKKAAPTKVWKILPRASHLSVTQLELLIKINAFRFIGRNKYQLMWRKQDPQPERQQVRTIGCFF